MADAIPLKLVDNGDGTGQLVQFTSGDTVPLDNLVAALALLGKLTPAADKLPYFNNQGAAALADLSVTGRNLISAADVASARSTLQLKALALQDTAAIANGGTGATTSSGARSNFGLGTSDVPSFSGLELYGSLPFVDFHFNNSTVDFNARIISDESRTLTIVGESGGWARFRVAGGYGARAGISGSFSGNSFNFNWTGDKLYAWIDVDNVGQVQINSSDYRIKKNITEVKDDFITRIKAYRVVTFQYRRQGAWKGATDTMQGLIAHEAKAANPLAATGEKDEVDDEGKPVIQNLNTFAIITDLIGAVQQQAAQISQLQADVDALKAPHSDTDAAA